MENQRQRTNDMETLKTWILCGNDEEYVGGVLSVVDSRKIRFFL